MKPQNPQSDPLQDRKRLTFEEAEGLEPLPTQLQLKELSPALRAALWAAVLASVDDASHTETFGRWIGGPWDAILKDDQFIGSTRWLTISLRAYRLFSPN
jgi:hypothetical protein